MDFRDLQQLQEILKTGVHSGYFLVFTHLLLGRRGRIR